METRDKNAYRMLTIVVALFAANKSLKAITDLPALVKARDELDGVTTKIAAELEGTAAPPGPSPESQVKATLFDEMIDGCVELVGAIHAYAEDNRDPELAAKSDYSEADLTQGSEQDIAARCAKIVSLGTEVADDLDDYGYTAQDIAAIGKTTEAFVKACPQPRRAVGDRSAANKAVDKLLRKGKRIVTRRMDKLALQLRKSAPTFYDQYRSARKVTAPAKPSKTSDTNAQPTPVPKAA